MVMLPTAEGNKNIFQNIKAPLIFTFISAVVFILLAVLGALFIKSKDGFKTEPNNFARFKNEEELREYLATSPQSFSLFGFGGFATGAARDLALPETNLGAPVALDEAKRVSQTNVQVAGLDEPDIVKTDGKNIYFSSQNYAVYSRPVEPLPVQEKFGLDSSLLPPVPPDFYSPKTKVVSAFPAETIKLQSEIDANGDMLLEGNTLMIFTFDKIKAFDVSNPANPTTSWEYKLEENFTYSTARLTEGKLYVVGARYADVGLPCPVPLFQGMSIPCTDIYRPGRPISAESLYTVIKIDPKQGTVEDTVSFIGSNTSVIYMSPGALYASFTTYPNPLEFMANFLSENNDLFPGDVVGKINNLRSLDISQESKMNELGIIIQRHLSQLSNDERARVETELSNRMNSFSKQHGRELQLTKIVKINKTLDIVAEGEVPGSPLNQFSLDEYNGDLRIATTLSASNMFGSGESSNDLYVLSDNLDKKGELLGLALGEQIYSVRFMGDRAYIVTFKQIDPFFVIDLTNPASPKVAGELKIPGFSSYLHPLSGSRILGIGQEGSQVKLSVFDVSNAQNPTEVDKYVLNEFWTEVQNNYRAFLADEENKIFFMPSGTSGYIFDYSGALELKKVVSDISAKRALYINNFLYVVGDSKIVVLSQDSWEEVSNLEF